MNDHLPFQHTELAVYLRKRIEALEGIKSQAEIAVESGYDKPNIISMFKAGEARVPLDRIPALAKALQADPRLLMGLGLEQHFGNGSVLVEMFKNTVSDGEMAIIGLIRDLTGGTGMSLTPALAGALRKFFVEGRF